MNWSLKLVKGKGIDIKVHLTFVLILLWAAYRWSVSTNEAYRLMALSPQLAVDAR